MTTFATAADLAGLPSFPKSERRARDTATRMGLPCRPRHARGGGFEYSVEALPPADRAAWIARCSVAAHGPYATAAELSGLPGLPESEWRTRAHLLNSGVPTSKRAGRGGGLVFAVDALPLGTRLAYFGRQQLKPASSLGIDRTLHGIVRLRVKLRLDGSYLPMRWEVR